MSNRAEAVPHNSKVMRSFEPATITIGHGIPIAVRGGGWGWNARRTSPSTSAFSEPFHRPRPPNGVNDHPPMVSLSKGQSSRVGIRGNGIGIGGTGLSLCRGR
ncbi:hypothetical protein AG1IA_00754 [Rhizoctonia solani AG-1 IA]|uniref:Uncharacterized protein n=1 Tax=Thanatephorus cucumeris (strain AG1-IA) TaxID=983506 RepID=L8X4U2_THACA|nr:hypothetical protein AG1IA_00754 [Rhizoctonia solani AG-1 IA]